MNLIEFIWAHVMRKLSNNPPTTLKVLQVRVYQIWNDLPEDSLARLYDRMARPDDALMRAIGYPKK